VPGLEHFVLCCAPEKKARRPLFQPSRGVSVPDLLCFTKSWGEPRNSAYTSHI